MAELGAYTAVAEEGVIGSEIAARRQPDLVNSDARQEDEA
jgi:hypothetical protein